MKYFGLFLGIFLFLASTVTIIILRYYSRYDIPLRSRMSVFPHTRNEAIFFSFQLSGLLIIIIALFYEKMNFDTYFIQSILGPIFVLILLFGPILLGLILSVVIIKVKNLQ